MDEPRLITLAEIEAAAERLRGLVARTPVVVEVESGIRIKAESLQPSGAFKLRGAFNALLGLDDEQRRVGVVAHSSGNHAIAVAMAAAALGVRATIVMPSDAPAVKLSRTRSAGADVELVGPSSGERSVRAAELAARRGLVSIEPYDSDAVLCATGTIGVELLDDLASVGDRGPIEVYAPVSGGGLCGGLAAGLKLAAGRREVRVIGVEPELAADARASWQAGRRVELPAEDMARTAADGLRVQVVGERTWPHLQAFVDDIVMVSEAEIRHAARRLATGARLVAEPSGAVAAAAALAGRGATSPARRRIAVLSGGNVDPAWLAAVLGEPGS